MIERPSRLRIDRIVFLDLAIDQARAEAAVSSMMDALTLWGVSPKDIHQNAEWSQQDDPSELGKILAGHVMVRVLAEARH